MRTGDCFSTTMRLRSLALVLAVPFSLSIAGSQGALAQPADVAGFCSGRVQASLDERIRACSSLIDAQQGEDNQRLALLHTSRGAYWRAKGDLARAMADHDEAIRLQPASALLYFNRAITWLSKDAIDRAITDFNEAIRLAPEFVLAYRNLGDLLYGKGDYAGAIRTYDAVIRLMPRDSRALTMRGLAKWQLGDGNGGKTDIATAMRIDAATAVALVDGAQPVGTAAAVPPAAGAPMIWDFKGSQIALHTDGANERFYYETPRPELVLAGVAAGALLFEGHKQGNQYAGKAFVFSRKCGARGYDVAGPLDDSSSKLKITLSGKRPVVDANCRPTGSFQNDVLIFSYVPH